ncbi:MAG: PQQ-binding-like beta-propeller repeat protein [Thermoanaerobaculia bacterium]
MLRSLVVGVVSLLATVSFADTPKDLLLAARSGDIVEVRRLVEGGLSVDSSDTWGMTALALAARWSQVGVTQYLLEKGADPNAREGFFGMSPLDYAIWQGAPDYRVAKILLAGGAEDRAAALEHSFENEVVDLALAALESGPVLQSEAAELKTRFTHLEGELAEILGRLQTRPDPPPPAYTAEELAGFVGHFSRVESATVADTEVRNGRLVVRVGEVEESLSAVAERSFRGADGTIKVRFLGRAGVVEAMSLERSGEETVRLRLRDDSKLVAWTVPSGMEPTVHAEPTVHWPGFRGLNRSGIGDGVDPPVHFDLETGAGVAWRVGIPGLGNSSPVVWGDRVYVTTAVAEGGSVPLRVGRTGSGEEVEEAREHRWLVLAIDKASGETLWETVVGQGVPLTRRHFKATQANSTPAVDGAHVVVVFPTAGLACLGTDGSIHWKHELGGLNAGGFNDPGLQWGFASSPIIHQGRVFLQVDIHEGPYLAAWDLETGRELWRTDRGDVAPSWATPAIWATATGDELVTNASIIRGYDPETGTQLWSLAPTSVQVVASPVVGPEHLFVSSGYPPARPIYAVRQGIRGDHEIHSDEESEVLAWHRERGGAYMPTPLLYRGLLYIVHHDGRLVAHDAATGAPVYRARQSAGGTNTSSPVAANGVIYQGTEEGNLYVIKAGPEYHELAVHDFGAPLMATPAISEGILLVRTPSELIALRKP